MVLPHGLYYSRLDAVSSIAVAGAHLAGELDLDHLRGRSSYPMGVQAAEIALRRDLGATRDADVALVRQARDGELTTASFEVAGGTYDVVVRTTADPETATRLTCKALRDNPVPRHDLVSVARRA